MRTHRNLSFDISLGGGRKRSPFQAMHRIASYSTYSTQPRYDAGRTHNSDTIGDITFTISGGEAIQEPVFRYRLWRRARTLTPPGCDDRVSSAHSQEEDRPQAHALQYFTLRRSPPSRARVTSTGGALASGRGTLDGAYYSHAERKSQYGLGNALSNSARSSHLTGMCTMVPRRI